MAHKIIYVNCEPDPKRDAARRREMCRSGEAPGMVVRGKSQSQIAPDKRVLSNPVDGDSAAYAERMELAYQRDIEAKRKVAESGRSNKKRRFKQTHSVPAHLYHGKIRETGDKHYWDDPKNLNSHTDCKVQD